MMNELKSGQYLSFRLGSEWFAVPIELVREINRVGEITPVPRSPEFLSGVINLRGKIVPVVDLRLKMGMEQKAFDRQTCIVVFELTSGLVGGIVDSVQEVSHFDSSQLEKNVSAGIEGTPIFGIAKMENRVVLLVDIQSALSLENVETFMSVA